MAVAYNRNFQYEDRVDGVDRVSASGPLGFNLLFHLLEAEFDALGGVVAQISTALDALAERPPAEEARSTFTPTLVPITADPWEHVFGLASKPPGATSAHGMMSIELPDGVRIASFRATGENSGPGNLRLQLRRQGVGAGAGGVRIVRVDGTGGQFDVTTAAPSTDVAIVDNQQFKYFITAELDNALSTDAVQLNAFQVIHIAQ